MAPLAPDYLQYPRRRRGMDHDRYEFRAAPDRPRLDWPHGAGLALTPVVNVESFRLDDRGPGPKPIASPMVEYPDFWGYTRLDYGNRAAIERVARALDAAGVRAAAAVDAEACERYPRLVAELADRDWEIVGHGLSGSVIIHEGMDEATERELIAASLATLREAVEQPVRGWLSPSFSESLRTPDLLAEQGVEYVLDWVNDDVPDELRTAAGALCSVPCSYDLSDLHLIGEQRQAAWEYVEQVVEAARRLHGEAGPGRVRVLSFPLHPWIIGVPHRAGHLEALLSALRELDDVWWTTAGAVARAYRKAAEVA